MVAPGIFRPLTAEFCRCCTSVEMNSCRSLPVVVQVGQSVPGMVAQLAPLATTPQLRRSHDLSHVDQDPRESCENFVYISSSNLPPADVPRQVWTTTSNIPNLSNNIFKLCPLPWHLTTSLNIFGSMPLRSPERLLEHSCSC